MKRFVIQTKKIVQQEAGGVDRWIQQRREEKLSWREKGRGGPSPMRET